MRLERSNPDGVSPPLGTYSHVVRVETGDAVWLHVSGQIAVDPTGAMVGVGDMRAQTERVYENLRAILEAHGATFADVVKMNTYVTSLEDLAGMREVRSRYLASDLPASTAVQVVALVVPEALIEVDAVAVIHA
ncbi:MAG TPA: RidA family protein [Actinomycetota bacterium]|nr:RidA family protein [Actinomycetota bacterium]